MKKELVFFLVFLVLVSGGFADDGWASINNGSGGCAGDECVVGDGGDVGGSYDEGYSPALEEDYQGDETFFTASFYIALVLIVLVLIVVLFVVWVFLKGPRNEWEKEKPVAVLGDKNRSQMNAG